MLHEPCVLRIGIVFYGKCAVLEIALRIASDGIVGAAVVKIHVVSCIKKSDGDHTGADFIHVVHSDDDGISGFDIGIGSLKSRSSRTVGKCLPALGGDIADTFLLTENFRGIGTDGKPLRLLGLRNIIDSVMKWSAPRYISTSHPAACPPP